MIGKSLNDLSPVQVASFGVGGHVKLPGPSQKQPNIYKFGTPYQDIYNDLLKQNRDLYVRNGLLPMLERNMGVKDAPERWQDNRCLIDLLQCCHQHQRYNQHASISGFEAYVVHMRRPYIAFWLIHASEQNLFALHSLHHDLTLQLMHC